VSKLTITEAARTVNRSRQTIYNYVKSGKLKSNRNGKGYDIELEELRKAFDMSNDTSSKSSKFDTSTSNDDMSNQVSNEMPIDKYIDTLTHQLEEKDKQVEELHQIIAMQQKSVQQLTEQILLEDKSKQSWWERLFHR